MFSGILGHGTVIEGLRRVQDSGRVAHAWLFAGPDGVGKSKVAVAFAQRLNCKDRTPTADACGECRPCRQIAAGTHPDWTMVEPDGQFIKIERVREVTRSLRYAPIDGNFRVLLMHEADRLHEAAANALLKTLEEPAAGNVFILLTSKPGSVMATIRSRCQMVRFSSLSREDVAGYLMREKGLDAITADEVAGLADGSLSGADTLTSATAMQLREEWTRQLSAIPKLSPMGLLKLAESMTPRKSEGGTSTEREALRAILDIFRISLRDAMLRAAGMPPERLVMRHRAPHLPTTDPERLRDALALVQDAEIATARNVAPKLVAEHVLLGLRTLFLAA
ncbi:MAG: DNA polymerase III subunit delta' [Myxococcales bacterium]|nr:DNA polymerase III subunit delta' [Myxococcales bacterium]